MYTNKHAHIIKSYAFTHSYAEADRERRRATIDCVL